MTTRLGLRRLEGPAGTRPAAWFVPGSEARQWLDELCAFGVELAAAELLLVPRSRTDRAPIGLLVVLPAEQVPHLVVRALPYACRAGSVLLPSDAMLWPPVDDDELAAAQAWRWLVFHPAVGCIGYAAEDVRRVADLLRVDVRREQPWDRALPGLVPIARLTAIEPAEQLDVAAIFAPESGAIGSRPPSAIEPGPGEAQPGEPRHPDPRGLGQAWRERLARLVLGLTRQLPHTADHTTWVNRLEDWAHRVLARAPARPPTQPQPEADEARRRREIERLLELLAKDPDRGLEYALPVGGDLGRGIATPANQLGPRDVDFDARRLGGGGATDSWQLPDAVHRDLQRHYRELANREIQLGRHRRAAYIFAHLLGDLRAAALTLRDGGFHREAAVLFHERLHDVPAAVQCLVRGGLLGEAADFEEAHRNWENAGDLRLMLGQTEAADELYRRAHVALQTEAAWIPAALLRAEKLRDVDGALADLHRRWQSHADSQALAAWFGLAQRQGQHDDLRRVILECTGDEAPPTSPAAVHVLACFFPYLQAKDLRDLVRDQVRCRVAKVLTTSRPREQAVLLAALRFTSPGDRLLAYDTRRIDKQLPAVALLARGPGPGSRLRLVRLEQRLLPKPRQWRTAIAGAAGLIVAGRPADRTHLQLATWQWQGAESGSFFEPFLLRAVAAEPLQLLSMRTTSQAWLWHANLDGEQGLLRTSVGMQPSSKAGHRRLPEGTTAVAVDDDGSIWSLAHRAGAWVLQHEAATGALLHSQELPRSKNVDPTARCHLAAVAGLALLAVGDVVWLRDRDGYLMGQKVEGPVRSLVRSEEGSNTRVLVGLDVGFLVVDLEARDLDRLPRYATELVSPTLGWTRLGAVIAIDAGASQLFRSRDGALVFEGQYGHPQGQPWAILPTPELDEVVLIASQTATWFKVVG